MSLRDLTVAGTGVTMAYNAQLLSYPQGDLTMVAVNYGWDELEDNIDEEYNDSGSSVAEYTNELYLYGDLISQRRNGKSRFYCFDGLGCTPAVTDSGGTVTDTNAYTAFDEVLSRVGCGNWVAIGLGGRHDQVRAYEGNIASHLTYAYYPAPQFRGPTLSNLSTSMLFRSSGISPYALLSRGFVPCR